MKIVTYFTPEYERFFYQLKSDCVKLDYSIYGKKIAEEFSSIYDAWNFKPYFIRDCMAIYDKFLFLDAECRILKSIPESWSGLAITTRINPPVFWLKYNTGTILIDKESKCLVDHWVNLHDDWQFQNSSKSFKRKMRDCGISDELSFSAAVSASNTKVNTIELEYLDRNSLAPVVRGEWKNCHTIIQHPTTHHWPKQTRPTNNKKLFIQNYGGDAQEIEKKMKDKKYTVEETISDWWFDFSDHTYAPLAYKNNVASWEVGTPDQIGWIEYD